MTTLSRILTKPFRLLSPPIRANQTPSAKVKVQTVVVIPLGPKCKMDYVLDTIASVQHYITEQKAILIADDSQNAGYRRRISSAYPDIIILSTKQNLGKGLGLYTNLSYAYRYALDHFDFETLLRLDTDALMIGYGADKAIASYFAAHPKVGLAGTFIRGNQHVDEFGNVWDAYGGRIYTIAIAKIFSRYFLRSPVSLWRIRRRLFKAIYFGYEFGDLIFGGSYAFSRAGLEALRANGLLPIPHLMGIDMEEDHLFSLLMRSINMELGDLGQSAGPFGNIWKGLPATPEKLCEADKKIVHSTRYYKNQLREGDIRAFFRAKREAESANLVARR
ncbi:MAG: hypothetical protein QM762_21650 [Chryseolinea sp.]